MCICTDLNTRKVGKQLSLIRNNTRKLYGLKLFLVISKCGLKIEIIEGFIKGLMWVFLWGSLLPLRKGYIRNVMASSIVILMGLSNGAFRGAGNTCQHVCVCVCVCV